MHDGQNLFDNATSFSGEWQVDETLNSLFNAGDYGAIVIGIDNGGADRLNEYSPWVNTSYGGGQGTQYMQFVAETLKPYIDLNYRTKPQPQYNTLIGSSMGAFISAYGGVAYSNVFSKIGVFSPAFWFAKTDLDSYISNTLQPLNQARIYFVAGTNESTTMVSDCNQIKNSFLNKGVTTNNVFTKYDSYGAHNENYWKGEFAGAYQWLFQNELLQIHSVNNTEPVIIFTNDNNFYVSGLEHKIDAILFDLTGKNLGKIEISNGENKLNIDLSTGIYLLKSDDFLLKFSKQ
jgi:predicted alpha/beta superfamily hydrolase